MINFFRFITTAAWIVFAINANAQVPTNTGGVISLVSAQAKIFLADQRGDFHKPNALVRETILDFMSGDEPSIKSENLILYNGCRAHSCIEKGAVVATADGKRIVAAGLLNYNCKLILGSAITRSAANCANNPRLNLFIFRNSTEPANLVAETNAAKIISEWMSKFNPENESVEIFEKK